MHKHYDQEKKNITKIHLLLGVISYNIVLIKREGKKIKEAKMFWMIKYLQKKKEKNMSYIKIPKTKP